MKMLFKIKKTVVVVYLVFSFIFVFLIQNFITKPSANVNAATTDLTLENNQVYFIKNQKSGLYLDVRNYSGANGAKLNQYHWHGQTNQQFKLVRYSGNIFYIIPMTNVNRRVDVTGNVNQNNVEMQIWDANTTDAQKFKIENDGNNTGSYKILTATSNYSKCVTVQNASMSESAAVIQYTYGNNGTNDNDHWYFEKYDTMSVYGEKTCYIGKYSKNTFNLDFGQPFQSVNYVIDTTGNNDTIIKLFENGTQIAVNDDYPGLGLNSKIIFKALNRSYRVEVSLYGSNIGNCGVRLYPEKDVYFNSYSTDNPAQDPLDSKNYVDSLKMFLNFKGYYLKNENNSTINNMITPTINSDSKFNNDYYLMYGHGSTSGTILLSPNHVLIPSYHLPNMSKVKLAVWISCYAGAVGNAADVCVNQKNAQASLGWPGLLYTNTVEYFVEQLWNNLSLDHSIENSIREARSATSFNFWYYSLFGWGDDTIMDPTLYTPQGSAIILSIQTPDTNYENISKSYIQSEYKELNDFKSKNDYIAYNDTYNNITRYVKTVNGLITNEFFIEYNQNGKQNVIKSKNYFTENDLNILNGIDKKTKELYNINMLKIDGIDFMKQDIVTENEFYIKDKNIIKSVKRQQIRYISKEGFNYLKEYFWDMSNGEILSEQYINSVFGV